MKHAGCKVTNIYRITIGRDVVIEGSLEELAYRLDMKKESIQQMMSPAYIKARKKQKIKVEKIGKIDSSNIYQMFDKKDNWVGTGSIKELAEETELTDGYLRSFIEGSKTFNTYIVKHGRTPIRLVKVG